MSSAASHRLSIAAGSGGMGSKAGLIPNRSTHSTRRSAFDVRELTSAAIDRMRFGGTDVNSATEATGPSDAIAMPATMRYAGPRPRRYSIDGIMPRSMDPSCSNAAHFDGTSKRSENRSFRSSSP